MSTLPSVASVPQRSGLLLLPVELRRRILGHFVFPWSLAICEEKTWLDFDDTMDVSYGESPEYTKLPAPELALVCREVRDVIVDLRYRTFTGHFYGCRWSFFDDGQPLTHWRKHVHSLHLRYATDQPPVHLFSNLIYVSLTQISHYYSSRRPPNGWRQDKWVEVHVPNLLSRVEGLRARLLSLNEVDTDLPLVLTDIRIVIVWLSDDDTPYSTWAFVMRYDHDDKNTKPKLIMRAHYEHHQFGSVWHRNNTEKRNWENYGCIGDNKSPNDLPESIKWVTFDSYPEWELQRLRNQRVSNNRGS